MLESVVDQLLAHRRSLCPVGKWIQTLEVDDQARMTELLQNGDISAAELVRVLRAYVKFSESSMRRHRARFLDRDDVLTLCSCA